MLKHVTKTPALPPVLYHYTDTAGLLGILGNPVSFPGTDTGVFATEKGATFGTLWATDARYLNDAQELSYGRPGFADALEKAAATSTTSIVSDRLRELAGDVRDGRFEYTIGSKIEKSRPYVTCFCTSGNLLSQWRGYGDGGGGYAIGFSSSAVEQFITIDPDFLKTDPRLAVLPVDMPRKVHYGARKAAPFLKAEASMITVGLQAVEDGTKTYHWPDTFRGVASTSLAQVKHKAFKEESEWRLIVDEGRGKDSQFRAGRIGLIPYRKLYFPITKSGQPSVSRIVVGPGGDRALRIESLRQLVEHIGSTGTEVIPSEVPFRG